MPNRCPFCNSLDLKEENDKTKQPISFAPLIYPKKYTCKKCRKSFSKEQMENPASASKPQEHEEASAASAAAPEMAEAAAPPAKKKGMAARLFETEASTAETGPSSEPAPEAIEPEALPSRRAKGFATLDTSSQQQAPAEKKSYMQIMKEKSLYQAQQFESTMEVEAGETKPAPKPVAQQAVAKPAGMKPAAPVKPVKPVKPAGSAPAVPKPPSRPAPPQKSPAFEGETEPVTGVSPPGLPDELPDLPDLPSMETSPEKAAASSPPVMESQPEMEEFGVPVAPPVQKPAGMKPPAVPAMQKPAGMKPPVAPPVQKPAGMKPPVGPPVQKPAGMKPPVGPPVQKPAGMKPPAVQKPAGMKSPAVQKPAGMKPPIQPPGQFQSIEPATRAAPFPAVQAPATPQGSRLEQLMAALNAVLGSLQWPQEKKDALMHELETLPEDQQTDFLEQLGVEIPAPAPAVQPVPQAPEEALVSTMPSMPEAPEAVVPVPPMKMPARPPAKPAGMKPVKPSGMKPVKPAGIAPPVAPPGMAPVPPVMKPMKPAWGAKPAVVPPVAPPGEYIAPPVMKPMKPAWGAKPAVVPPVLPPEEIMPSFTTPVPARQAPSAGDLFKDIDQEITSAVGGDMDFGKLLEADLAKTPEFEAPVPTKRGKGKKGAKAAASIEEEMAVEPAAPEVPVAASKGPIKLSQISTKVEKKSAADLKREEEKLKAASASESSLVYMRLLGFEKLASGGKSYKLSEFCKTLKDIDPQVVIDFIKAVDNDMLIFYEESKGQVVVSDLSGPELEIMSRQFEKWLRFGRL